MHEVRITSRAEADIEEAWQWWSEHRSTELADRWYSAIYPAIESLTQMPERCALAPERDEHQSEVRHLLFGINRQTTHRIVFALQGDTLVILRVLHAARDG